MTRVARGDFVTLLAAIVELDERTRGLSERDRSEALSYVSGVCRAVVKGLTSASTAATVVRSWRPLEGPGATQRT
jgi:hypothetical protein